MADSDVQKGNGNVVNMENVAQSNTQNTVTDHENIADFDESQSTELDKLRSVLSEVLPEENKTDSNHVNNGNDTCADTCSDNQEEQNASNNTTKDSDIPAADAPDQNLNPDPDHHTDEEKSAKYIPPIEDPHDKAWKYLSKHNILALFGTITADIVYGKPTDPLQFMIDEIEKLQEQDRIRKGVIKRTASAAIKTDKSHAEQDRSILDELPS